MSEKQHQTESASHAGAIPPPVCVRPKHGGINMALEMGSVGLHVRHVECSRGADVSKRSEERRDRFARLEPDRSSLGGTSTPDDQNDGSGYTMHERWWSQILGAIVGSCATFSVTLTSGHGAVMLGQLKDGNYNVTLTGRQGQWLMSVYMLGIILGTCMSMTILRRIGPARLMLYQTIPNLVGVLLQTIDYTVEVLIVGRFLSGLAIGTCSSCSVIFIGEVCAPRLRGALLMIPGMALALGYAVSYGLGSVLPWTTLTWIVGFTPNIMMAVGLCILHESPSWLVNHHQPREAEQALLFYRGSQYPADREIAQMMRSAENRHKGGTIWGTIKLLRLQEHLVPFLLVLVQTVGNVWSGQVAVFSYAVVIFRQLGSHLNEYHCSLLLATIRLVVSVVAASVIDRIGRRILLLSSCITAALGMAATGLYFHLRDQQLHNQLSNQLQDDTALGWLPVIGLCLAVAGVSLGIDPLTWALMGELLPAAVRDQAGAFAATVWGLAYFLVVQTFPDMNRMLGVAGTFWFFMSCLIGNFVFVLIFLPETRGKSLLEIEDYFAKYKKHSLGTEDLRA